MLNTLRQRVGDEAATGVLLMLAALFALLAANTPLSTWYNLLLDMPVAVRVGPLEIDKPLLLWINDGLMAVFFFLVGLELKKEVLDGQLSRPASAVLPILAAVGGVAVPALVYLSLNMDNALYQRGWAIPTATDIAFSIGLLALFGSRVPPALRIFLLTLAVFDDLIAIIVIALFYTDNLSMIALAISGACCLWLWRLNRANTAEIAPYLLVGVVMWVALLKSGVHATLAGVVLAFFIPAKATNYEGKTVEPLNSLMHDLENAVRFGILPVFALANAGVYVLAMDIQSVMHPVTLGITLGLIVGKPVGIAAGSLLSLLITRSRLPEGLNWSTLSAVALLAGIGFTMSLFIAGLAFETAATQKHFDARLGILLGSLVSGILGLMLLNRFLPRRASDPETPARTGDPDQ